MDFAVVMAVACRAAARFAAQPPLLLPPVSQLYIALRTPETARSHINSQRPSQGRCGGGDVSAARSITSAAAVVVQLAAVVEPLVDEVVVVGVEVVLSGVMVAWRCAPKCRAAAETRVVVEMVRLSRRSMSDANVVAIRGGGEASCECRRQTNACVILLT